MSEKTYDVLIIGGGPAGYVAAIRAAQLGMKAAVMEKEHVGGTCLNVGCIPTKALFQSAEVAQILAEAKEYGVLASKEGIDFPEVMRRKDKIVAQLVGGVKYLLKKNKVDLILGSEEMVALIYKDTLAGDTQKSKADIFSDY